MSVSIWSQREADIRVFSGKTKKLIDTIMSTHEEREASLTFGTTVVGGQANGEPRLLVLSENFHPVGRSYTTTKAYLYAPPE